MQNNTGLRLMDSDKLQALEDRIAVLEGWIFDPDGANNTLAKTLVQQIKLLDARLKVVEQQLVQAGIMGKPAESSRKGLREDTLDRIVAETHRTARQALAQIPSRKSAPYKTVLGLRLRE